MRSFLGPGRWPALVAVLVAVAVVTGACTSAVSGRATAAGGVIVGDADTSILQGTDHSSIDELAAAAISDIRTYWEQTYPEAFGEEWDRLDGGYHSLETADDDAASPPCMQEPIQAEGNAFYCPEADAIAWDRSALLPVLRDQHGGAAVVVVLAHEVGHAVHHRLGIDTAAQRAQPDRYPTILLEAIADCFSGAFVRWVRDGHADHLRISERQLDRALSALITFRDPVGITATDRGAHGNAFDRVSAFQDGYESGAATCAGFSVDNRQFTQIPFLSPEDAASGGNLPFDQMVDAVTGDLGTYFGSLVRDRNGSWRNPGVRDSPQQECASRQGPAAFCREENAVWVDDTQLPELHRDIGDYATGTLLATRYALAARIALDESARGSEAQREALCLAGSYSHHMLNRSEGFRLSPGDLDEAVEVLLSYDYGSRDLGGEGISSGFERVETYRSGTLQGVAACGIN